MGGISADDPDAVKKLTAKLEKLTKTQETMKAVNAYYRKHKSLEGCPELDSEAIEKLKKRMEISISHLYFVIKATHKKPCELKNCRLSALIFFSSLATSALL